MAASSASIPSFAASGTVPVATAGTTSNLLVAHASTNKPTHPPPAQKLAQAALNKAPLLENLPVPDDDVQIMQYQPSATAPNSGTFILPLQDHAVGNLVEHQMARDMDRVWFVGYHMPHPFERIVHVEIRTRPETTPGICFHSALQTSITELQQLARVFEQSVQTFVPASITPNVNPTTDTSAS